MDSLSMNLANKNTEPIHVLFLVDVLHGLEFRDGSASGLAGIEGVLLKIMRLIPRDRYRFSLATFSLGRAVPDATQLPCPLHVFPLKKSYDWNALRMAGKLRKLIRSENVSIVHTFLESADIWGGLVAKLSGCPILISSRRDMGYFRSKKHGLGYRLVNPLVDQVQAVSEEVRSFLISHDRLDPQKVFTLYNGVELDRLAEANGVDPLRMKLGLDPDVPDPDSPVITTTANIRPVKGLDVLIQAAAKVCREFPRARFLIAGEVIDRPYFEKLQEMVRTLQLTENVIFLGRSDRVPSLLKLSTLFCMLSRSEGFSNAILEAMAIGLPCVVTKVGGNAEAVEEGKSGFLVASEDADSAADRILTLLRDPQRARKMGEAGRSVVATKFTAQGMASRWAALYDELVARRCNRQPAPYSLRTGIAPNS
jgi:glycosyltransferase involved in cell wall biosynthesis